MKPRLSSFLYKFDPDWEFAKQHGKASKAAVIQLDHTRTKK